MTETDLYTTISNTIEGLLANFDDKYTRQDAKFKGTIEETIADQDAKSDAKPEKQFQTLSLQIK